MEGGSGGACHATLPGDRHVVRVATEGFATEEKERQWRAFLGKGRLAAPESLKTVIQHLAAFLGPVLMDGGTSRRHSRNQVSREPGAVHSASNVKSLA